MTKPVRSIFLSDIHLGTRACQADRLLEFLKAHDSQFVFLIGDILDFWSMKRRGVYWSTAQNTLIQKILKRARHHARVIFIPGNHDEAAREHVDTSFGNIHVVKDYEHIAADGKRYLLLHGDEFDQVTRHHRWIAILGDQAYSLLVNVNIGLSWTRRRLGIPGYWSLAGYAKGKLKKAVNFIFDFEESVARHARDRGMAGVICGHIHAATIRERRGSPTSIAATGWTAAPRSWSISTDVWSWSSGPRSPRTHRSRRSQLICRRLSPWPYPIPDPCSLVHGGDSLHFPGDAK